VSYEIVIELFNPNMLNSYFSIIQLFSKKD